jgi:hypothetical protein
VKWIADLRTNQAVHLFRARHQADVDAALAIVRTALANVWTTHKPSRIEALTADIHKVDRRIAEGVSNETFVVLCNLRRNHLRAIAEELGDIPRIMVGPAKNVEEYSHLALLMAQAAIGDDESLPVEIRRRMLAELPDRIGRP